MERFPRLLKLDITWSAVKHSFAEDSLKKLLQQKIIDFGVKHGLVLSEDSECVEAATYRP